MAALGNEPDTLPHNQSVATHRQLYADLVAPAAAVDSRRVFGGAIVRRAPGERGKRRLDRAAEKRNFPGVLSIIGALVFKSSGASVGAGDENLLSHTAARQ